MKRLTGPVFFFEITVISPGAAQGVFMQLWLQPGRPWRKPELGRSGNAGHSLSLINAATGR